MRDNRSQRLCAGRIASWLVLAAVAAAASGCFKEEPRIDVAGQVTYKGQPVPAGQVFFDPDPTQGHDGPQGYAAVKDGRYDTRQGGRGVAPGPHRVRVYGFDGKPGEELPIGRMIFPEYTAPIDLSGEKLAAKDIDVPVPGGKDSHPR